MWRPARRSCAVAITLLLALLPAAAEEPRELYLEVILNGQTTSFVARVVDLGGGQVSISAEDLAEAGVDPAGQGPEVRLDRMQGIGWHVDEAAQTLVLEAGPGALAPHLISFSPPPEEQTPPQSGFGAVLNYGLAFDTSFDGQSRSFGGDFDLRLFSPAGALVQGFTLAEAPEGGVVARRLSTTWRSAFPGRAWQIQLGDVTTRGPGWARPVRLGGVMAERNFALRPDLVTIPLPRFEGSAALPSTLEVWSDSIRYFSTDVPAGPFAVTDLPVGSGSGAAELVLRDTTGRETRMALPFLVSSDLMRRGSFDWALASGRPRLGMGTGGDHYGEETFTTASLRFGLTDRITLDLHGETGPGLAMAGGGVTFALATLGTVGISHAQSRADEFGEGRLTQLSTRLELGRTMLSARVLRTSGAFADIAGVTAEGGAPVPIREAEQLSLSRAFAGTGLSGSLFHAATRDGAGERQRSLGIGLSRTFENGASLDLSLLAQRGEERDAVLALGFRMPLGDRGGASTRVERRGARMSAMASLDGGWRSGERDRSWRIDAIRSSAAAIRASASAEFGIGRLDIATRLSRTGSSAGLRADGALVLAGGGVFLARTVHDSFAVVDAGAPGVEVSHENRPIGRTGRSGKILVPDLRSYEKNRLEIDPSSLPLDAMVGETRIEVRPGFRSGVAVSFGVDPDPAAALVGLVLPTGEPAPVGLAATLNGGETFLTGYDGLVYAEGLAAENELVLTLPDGSTCRAAFAYRDQPGVITEIPGVTCR